MVNKIASFFAGVGGIDRGFAEAGDFKTIYANEFDNYAADTFSLNFDTEVDRRDLTTVPSTEIPDFDVLLGGFPCQAFSIAGYRQGFNDEQGRGNLFFELVRIIKAKRPRVAFFENVKNLVSHDNGNTFRVIQSELDKLGYKYLFQVLNASEFGNIPQNRERIYIVAFRDAEDYANFSFPKSIPLTTSIHDVIDFQSKDMDDAFYYSAEKNVFYKELKDNMTSHDSVYQWRRKYVRENKSHVVPTLTANMGTGGHNVPLILTMDSRIRKLTPKECFNVQGFPTDFNLPKQSNGRLYKQAGNSVCVPVIKRIAEQVDKAMKTTDATK
ncbi:DNA cytosine methyltransferase [Fructobacillus tropaeoli]|uniref:Cytosine-specific methyltransferase n=1 Tax=Fructobacillus tropaeoli TaxID=709323 RepID=A0A3F3H264_9LACO|nr:type II methylase [Fructobacillus tropaeoli]